MLKVFLVEDEIIMREGIKNNIDWEGEGFHFAGEASDGELALPLIQERRPDILITDIKMPFMDGLELSRLVKQEIPDIKIIILSGYDEFAYAKEAISIGITDYLVKPVSGAQLLGAVKKVEKVILEEQEKRRLLESAEREKEKNAYFARGQLFVRMVSGTQPVSVLLEEGRRMGIELAAKRYNIVLFQVFSEGGMEGYWKEKDKVVRAMARVGRELPQALMFDRGLEGFAFLLKETEEMGLERLEEEFLGRLLSLLREEDPALEYFGGVGVPVGRLGELNQCFEKASRAFSGRYGRKGSQIARFGDMADGQEEGLSLSSIDVAKLDQGVVESFLKTGLKSEVRPFVEDYLGSLGEGSAQSALLRQYATMSLYLSVASTLEKMGHGSEELTGRLGSFQEMADAVSTAEKSQDFLERLLEGAIDIRDRSSGQKYTALLRNATDFIREHYDEESISLNTVAASVSLSPNHFSTIFSQEMGQTFVEYLTQVRMEKAKELLRGSSLKTSEIAFAVGYKDPHYFSYLFKKTQNCTPKEFRSRS